MIDTRAEVTWLPERELRAVGIGVFKKGQVLVLANGQEVTRDVGIALLRTGEFKTVDEVVFARPGDLAILGARTLEGFNVRVDPRRRRLVTAGPMTAASRREKNMKGFRKVLIPIFILTVLSLFLIGPSPQAGAAEKVQFSLSWLPYGIHVGFYSALSQGYYRDAGLDVAIQRGFGSGDSIKKLMAGSVEVAEAGLDMVVVARARGSKVVATGVRHAKNPQVIYTLKGSGITHPKDLVGRSVGTAAAEIAYLIFPAFAAKVGIDPAKVQFRIMEGGVKFPSLIAGSVDAVVSFMLDLPVAQSGAAKAGKEVVAIRYADYGVDTYSNGIVVTEATLENRPETVRRFLNATYRGHVYGVEHPEEAVRQFVQMEPANDLEISRKAWALTVDHLIDDYAKKEGLGHISKEKMEYTRDLMVEYMKLPVKEPVEKIYTNAYLPKLFPKRP